jgi:biotin carboxyl carrier protein
LTVEVEVGGHTRAVDVVPVPGGWSLIVDGRSYEVAVDAGRDRATVYINGQPVPVTFPGAARFGSSGGRGRGDDEAGASGPRRIVAPMPGRIVRVLVRPGDEVAPRQGLIVVEAMKMENELRAPGAGIVTDVKVVEGASVEANAVLVVLS